MTNGTIQVVDEGPMTALKYLAELREVFEKEFLGNNSLWLDSFAVRLTTRNDNTDVAVLAQNMARCLNGVARTIRSGRTGVATTLEQHLVATAIHNVNLGLEDLKDPVDLEGAKMRLRLAVEHAPNHPDVVAFKALVEEEVRTTPQTSPVEVVKPAEPTTEQPPVFSEIPPQPAPDGHIPEVDLPPLGQPSAGFGPQVKAPAEMIDPHDTVEVPKVVAPVDTTPEDGSAEAQATRSPLTTQEQHAIFFGVAAQMTGMLHPDSKAQEPAGTQTDSPEPNLADVPPEPAQPSPKAESPIPGRDELFD